MAEIAVGLRVVEEFARGSVIAKARVLEVAGMNYHQNSRSQLRSWQYGQKANPLSYLGEFPEERRIAFDVSAPLHGPIRITGTTFGEESTRRHPCCRARCRTGSETETTRKMHTLLFDVSESI